MRARFLADENVDPDLVSGLRRRVDGIDVVRVQDVGLRTQDDPTILRWAADQDRILVSHDLKTIPDFAYERVRANRPMPGVFVARKTIPLATVLDDLVMIAEISEAQEWVDQVVYLPLR